MKSARELFEELGYDYMNNKAMVSCLKRDRLGHINQKYYFLPNKVFINDEYPFYEIDMPTLKAIYKQCEELGWL